MNRLLLILYLLSFGTCQGQIMPTSTLEFSSDLKQFGSLNQWKETLKDVEIIALGENTHGLGAVFTAKTELVKFLHQELGFDLVLFESGYGDAALAWQMLDSLSPRAFTKAFSSNFYYHSEEIEALMQYVKSQNGALEVQGIDCQVQQDFLKRRMIAIAEVLDSSLAQSVTFEMRNFNNLYYYEDIKDTVNFKKQSAQFQDFLKRYNTFLNSNEGTLIRAGFKQGEIEAIRRSLEIFRTIYSELKLGDLMSSPIAYNLRDDAMYENVRWYKAVNPDAKIIIWAQNSHIENKSKPNYNIDFMGHRLKREYGPKYYSVGAVVYSGKNLNYSDSFDFEHQDSTYLAYHLNHFNKERFLVDLSEVGDEECTNSLLLGMESFGNTAEFRAKDRFDGLLFIRYSGMPSLFKED